ncbi:MAG TPA: type II CAAX endopeptidase family protein [Ornithinibacter sp.]|nr:type II CAAX endopeptidase family protein [Ornithinibacter sp.]
MTPIAPSPPTPVASAITSRVSTRPGGRALDLVGRRPLTSFFLLSCLLSWWPALLYSMGASLVPVASFGPFLAALIVLGATRGRAGVRALFRSMIAWRVPRRAYLLAIGLPLMFSGAAILANLAWGAEPSASDLATWTSIPVTALFVLLVPGIGGAWEEPGFRGFALQRLEERFGVMAGPLVLGVLWVVWHGPLFLVGQILWTDVLVIVAASVVIASVFHTARESVLVAMIMHATNNAVGGSYASQLFDGIDQTRLGTLTALAWWLGAAVVLVRMKHAAGRRAPDRSTA